MTIASDQPTSGAFDLADVSASDEAVLDIKHPKSDEPTGWQWTFFGPGHPRTVAIADRETRAMLKLAADKEQARVNYKKWKPEEETGADLRAKTVANIVGRTKYFTPVKFGSETIEFSPEAATKLLLDRTKGWLFKQVIDFISAEESFIQPSATS
jgi:hypothetical protein